MSIDKAQKAIQEIQDCLSPDLLKPQYRQKNTLISLYGHCYVAAESLYHMIGGSNSGFFPCRGRDAEGIVHWWLENNEGYILDPTEGQYTKSGKCPPYANGTRGGFLTKDPSKRSAILMERIQERKRA